LSRYLAIDIDPQGLFVVAGTVRGGAGRVEQALAWVPGNEHGPPPLTADTAKEIGEGLRDRLKAAGIAPAPVLVAVGRDKVILKELRYPAVPPAEEPALVRFQAMKEITENPDDVVLDYAPFAPDAAAGAERRATAVVVRKDIFAAVQALCAAAGLKLAAVTPRPFAVAAGSPRQTAGDAVAVLTLGPKGGEFTVVRGGEVVFARSVPAQVVGNDALLRSEVRRNLTVFSGQNPDHAVRAVHVAEADDRLGGWAARLGDGLPVPVHTYDPLAGAAADVPADLRGRFAGAAGLLAGLAAGPLPVNFAAPRQPKTEITAKRQLLTLAALVAVLVFGGGGLLGYVLLDRADRRAGDLQARKADLDKTLADLEPDRKRLDAADQWAGRGVNYLDELYDMTDRFPAGDQLRATKFKGTARPVDAKTGKQDAQALLEVEVGAKNADAAAAVVSAIERDNPAGGKAKFYVGSKKTIGGLVPGGGAFNQLFTLSTLVHHRDPAGYTRAPAFSPPPRRAALPADE